MKKWLHLPADKVNPNDKLVYNIPISVIKYSENILKEYGNIQNGNEGLVYWGGTKIRNNIFVKIVIAPKLLTEPGRVISTNRANMDLVNILDKYKFIHIGQVHSHPRNWVDHSVGDDLYAAFKFPGLLSIVVPNYCNDGMLPLVTNGIHRYFENGFHRLSDVYISEHFVINKKFNSRFVDMRN